MTTEFMRLLKRVRLEKGFSQTKLACRLGVDNSAVSLWESGAQLPAPKNIPKLARVLGISTKRLVSILQPDDEESIAGRS